MEGGFKSDLKQVPIQDVMADLIDEFAIAESKTIVFAKAERELRGVKIPSNGLSNDGYLSYRNIGNYSYIEFLERLMVIYEDSAAIMAMILPRHSRAWKIHNKNI